MTFPLNPSRVFSIVLRQYFLLRSSMTRLVPLFIWSGIDIILWGFITRYVQTLSGPGVNFVAGLLGAVLLWALFVRICHGLGGSFLEDVWSRNFLNVFSSPVTVTEYLTGLVLTSLAMSLISLAGLLLIAVGFFGLSLSLYGLTVLPCLLILYLFGIALGIFCIALVLRLGPAAEWFLWPLPVVLSPFAGVFYPVAILPEWMQHVAAALPLSYVFEGLRGALDGQALAGADIWMGLGLSLFYIAAAGAVFVATWRQAIRTGLIARYSAESVN